MVPQAVNRSLMWAGAFQMSRHYQVWRVENLHSRFSSLSLAHVRSPVVSPFIPPFLPRDWQPSLWVKCKPLILHVFLNKICLIDLDSYLNTIIFV